MTFENPDPDSHTQGRFSVRPSWQLPLGSNAQQGKFWAEEEAQRERRTAEHKAASSAGSASVSQDASADGRPANAASMTRGKFILLMMAVPLVAAGFFLIDRVLINPPIG